MEAMFRLTRFEVGPQVDPKAQSRLTPIITKNCFHGKKNWIGRSENT